MLAGECHVMIISGTGFVIFLISCELYESEEIDSADRRLDYALDWFSECLLS